MVTKLMKEVPDGQVRACACKGLNNLLKAQLVDPGVVQERLFLPPEQPFGSKFVEAVCGK